MKTKTLVLLSLISAAIIGAIVTGCKAPTPLQETAIHHTAKIVTSGALALRPQYLPAFQAARDQLLALSTSTAITSDAVKEVLAELNIGGQLSSIVAQDFNDLSDLIGKANASSTNFANLHIIAKDAGTGIGDGIVVFLKK